MTTILSETPPTGTPRRRTSRMDPTTKVAIAALILILLAAVVASWLPYGNANQVGFGVRLASPAPGWGLLGTDQLGRSMIPRVLVGTQVTLAISVPSAFGAAAVASVMAAFAAYFRGWFDLLATRLADLFFTFPSILLALLLVSIVGPGTAGAVVSIALIVSPQVFRVVRSRALEVAPREFIRSARVSGASPLRIVCVHILPNIAGTVVVQTTFAVVVAMLVESSLSFLGLGVKPPTASLGSLVHDGYAYLTSQPWLVFEPAAVLALTIFAVNLVGDWIRDRFEVREVAELS